MKKISPAIPMIKGVAVHVEQELGSLLRGQKHSSPCKAQDIKLLMRAYKESQLHQYKKGRKICETEKANDYVMQGFVELQINDTIAKWVESCSYTRSTSKKRRNINGSSTAEVN